MECHSRDYRREYAQLVNANRRTVLCHKHTYTHTHEFSFHKCVDIWMVSWINCMCCHHHHYNKTTSGGEIFPHGCCELNLIFPIWNSWPSCATVPFPFQLLWSIFLGAPIFLFISFFEHSLYIYWLYARITLLLPPLLSICARVCCCCRCFEHKIKTICRYCMHY